MLPLCGSGEFDHVSFPALYADAQMPLFACELKIDLEDSPPIILIFAGEPKYRGGNYHGLELIKAMMPNEFLEALYPEREE